MMYGDTTNATPQRVRSCERDRRARPLKLVLQNDEKPRRQADCAGNEQRNERHARDDPGVVKLPHCELFGFYSEVSIMGSLRHGKASAFDSCGMTPRMCLVKVT
ncbi:MAG: hypothetical protein ACXWUU_11775 [Burkholderiales bacterium]